ncbi:MAG: Flp family type IVb pilin [Bacillota bacterium]
MNCKKKIGGAFMGLLKKLFNDESGQALSEYGLVLGIVVIAVIVTLGLLKDKIIAMFQKILDALVV